MFKQYKATLHANNKKYIGKGKDAFTAISNIKMEKMMKVGGMQVPKLNTHGILRVEYDGKEMEMIMPINRLRRLFFNKLNMQITAKRFTNGLK